MQSSHRKADMGIRSESVSQARPRMSAVVKHIFNLHVQEARNPECQR